MLKVNAHIHTPYSFSAFESIDQALDMAVKENVIIVGINDFYTTEGYESWADGCYHRGLFPLFNIELIALNEADQKADLRINDPANPGRTYISGKGLQYPFHTDEPYTSLLQQVTNESNMQVETMCLKTNEILNSMQLGFTIDFQWIKSHLTKALVRERHLAKAIRIKLYENADNKEDIIEKKITRLFENKILKSKISDYAGIENEIRSNLLKVGGRAYIPEHPKAFLPVNIVCNIILNAGGIPTYPFLGDDVNGSYTNFENNLEQVAKQLTKRGFHSVEFISTRNDIRLLEKYVQYLYNKGFVVTLGSEHNTPTMEPIELTARDNTLLTHKLLEINYKGACVVAAHQHLVNQGLRGYCYSDGTVDRTKRIEFEKLGDEIIQNIVKNNNNNVC